MANNQYYKNLLGYILQGNQPSLSKLINLYANDEMDMDFEDMSIKEITQWLEDNYENIKNNIEII